MRAPATALAGLILTGALAAALTGCAPAVPTPADSAVASSTAVDTPTPTPTATQISLSATQVLLEDADGSPLTTLTYTDDPANVLAQLTATFGSQPTQKPYDGGLDGPSGTDYGWDGFTFESLDIAKPTSAQERFRILARKASSFGIVVSALGISVGTPLTTLKAKGGKLVADFSGGAFFTLGSTSYLGSSYSVRYLVLSTRVDEIFASSDDNGA